MEDTFAPKLPYIRGDANRCNATVSGQIHELELMKSKIYQLEQTHLAMKNG